MGYSAAYAVVALVSTAVAVDQGNKAQAASEEAADRDKKARAEQKASQSQQAAQERRQQIREERVRRARILQAGENTGTSESSGEFGAIGSLGTQLGSNIGFNLGQLNSAQRQSDLLQQGADFRNETSHYNTNAGYAQTALNLGTKLLGGR